MRASDFVPGARQLRGGGMTAALARLSAWLLEPAAPERPASSPAAALPTDRAAEVAVLAGPGAAGALAATLALRMTGGTAVVGCWTGEGATLASARPPLPALPAARRLATSLTARGLPARASGRLVTVALPVDEREAAAAATRLAAAVGDAPLVFAVGGPRRDAWDQVLVDCDLVGVHADDPALADLAVERLAEQGADAVRLSALPTRLARSFAQAGLALPGPPLVPGVAR